MWPWHTIVSKVTWWSGIIDFILFEFLDPENYIRDTEITSLSSIDPEIIEHIGVGSHLGRHLELWNPATGERHSPPIFWKHTSIRKKWDQSHLLIIKTATGIQVAQDYIKIPRSVLRRLTHSSWMFFCFLWKVDFFKISLSTIHQIERFEVRNSENFLEGSPSPFPKPIPRSFSDFGLNSLTNRTLIV